MAEALLYSPAYSLTLLSSPSSSGSSSRHVLPFVFSFSSSSTNYSVIKSTHFAKRRFGPTSTVSSGRRLICRAAEYKFPDPIPEFAEAETEKFRAHMNKKLSKKDDLFGDSVEEVVGICTEILGTFLHNEYGGPGTLLVIPFIDMADTLNERGLPGGPQAARAAVKWAQDHVDKDWKEWTGTD
ncbi:PREDICTED: uncharacterized protein LOC104819574 [Tarenaya hassleriana]|uniref:uncharacterized protein LOC104819574 n=1 Tax=Tarenaya hassleriana TaxID=28532 RepID=UPI00053C5F0A|nr:PREDICTED: uncharacterized protein LOC104819574 [Tarenaya hassleriana]